MNRDSMVTQIGLDCHRQFSKVTARGSDGKIAWRQRLEHGDRDRLHQALCEWPEGVPVIVEATFGWGWLSDELLKAGLEPHLANSRKVAGWRKARGLAKSDRRDADLLSELWDQRDRWWEVWLAPPQVRERRELLRYRMTLVRLQTGLKNRVHAVLHRHGLMHNFSDLFGVAGRRWLQRLSDADGELRVSTRATLKGYLQLLDHLRRSIAVVTRQFRRFVDRTPSATRLRTLPGVSYILAYTILAEIGQIDRFRNGKHLASYSLLAPRANDTGNDGDDDDTPKGRHVGFAGRRTLKWAWIQAAHGAVHRGGRMRRVFNARTNNGKRDRNRGYITVAHELCRLSHVLLTKNVDFTDGPPARPGSKTRKRRTSRPGTGQPDHPMVVVAT